MNAPTVLLCSHNASLTKTLEGVISTLPGLALEVCSDTHSTWARLVRGGVALLCLHEDAPNAAQIDQLLRRAQVLRQAPPVITISENEDAEQELIFLQQGVTECLSRPLDLVRLAYLLDTHTVKARLGLRTQREAGVVALGDEDLFLYLSDGSMGRLMEQVRRIAPQPATILLGGETGTGKTRLARLIHELSGRARQPFLTVHCGVLSSQLIESEMFGHVRGAFTGADQTRIGKFADAGEGTLLLDDIDALPLPLQAKLLRVVDERVFEPVGSNQSQPMRARLIVASNRSLEEEVAAGRFRADLFYRLNVVGFCLPPLRERRPVIGAIATKFIGEFASATGRETPSLTPEALAALEAHDWPGNVRELRNIVERAVALSVGDAIQPDDLPDPIRGLAPAIPIISPAASLVRSKEEAERHCIAEALERSGNNRLRAAAALGISRMTLYKKLHKYGLMGSG